MLIKRIIFFVFLNILSHTSKAQFSLGFEGGVNINTLKTNIANLSSTSLRSQVGYYSGVSVNYKLYHFLTVCILPNILQKNYSVYRTDTLTGIYTKYTNTYLQLPVMVQIKVGKNVKYFINSGIFGSYWLNSTIDGKIPDLFTISNNGNTNSSSFELSPYHNQYKFNKVVDNRIEMGWVSGLGIQYALSNKFTVNTVSRYYYSLSDRQKKYMIRQIPQYNQTLTVSIGLTYILSN